MSRRSRQKFIRTWHRRLGPIVGIQLLLWSLGGMYFSWVHITSVRSEADIANEERANLKFENFLAPIPPLIRNSQLVRVEDIRLGKLLNTPVYRFFQDDRHAETYDAITGEQLSPIGRSIAIAVAEASFAPDIPVRQVTRVEEQGGGYRGPVPAWKVTFDNWQATAIYVSANTGRVTARRSAVWRACAVLWWLPFGNDPAGEKTRTWIVRATSILGLVTIVSGFYLWYLTTPLVRPQRQKTRRKKK